AVGDVAREMLAAPGRVEPDDHRAGERRAELGEDELGPVLEQEPDVRRARAVEPGTEEVRVAAGLPMGRGERPGGVLEAQPDALGFRRIARMAPDELAERHSTPRASRRSQGARSRISTPAAVADTTNSMKKSACPPRCQGSASSPCSI